MSSLAVLLAGFFLVIAGMLMFGFAPGLGRLMVAAGALAVWLMLARAIERRTWSAAGRRLAQASLGAAVMAVAMTAVAPDLTGIMIAAAIGATVGAFAPQWSAYLRRST